MDKYSKGFKLKVIQEYWKGYLGYLLLVHKYGMPSSKPIKQLVRAFKTLGEKEYKGKQSMRNTLFNSK